MRASHHFPPQFRKLRAARIEVAIALDYYPISKLGWTCRMWVLNSVTELQTSASFISRWRLSRITLCRNPAL